MKILFICDGNVARSQEAELFLNTLANGKHRAFSAGVNPTLGKPIDPLVVKVMNEIGYSMDASVRKAIDPQVVSAVDIIVSFKPAEELPAFVRQLDNVRYWQVADPKGQSEDFHRQTRDLVRSHVEKLLTEL
jgi:protein-tyrosine-phosphatase